MALADTLLPVAREARGIAGNLGFRPHTVAIVTEYFSGQHTGEDSIGDEIFDVVEGDGQPPRVRQLKDDEVALMGLTGSVLEIGPMTPSDALDEQLFGAAPKGSTRYVRVTGPLAPNGAKFRIVGKRADRPLRRIIRVVPETNL